MRYMIALVLVSFLGLTVHAQEAPATPPPAGMDGDAPRDPAKTHHKKSGKKKKGHKKHKN